MLVAHVFARCAEARSSAVLIERASARDKEFHFQDWFRDRLDEVAGLTDNPFEEGGRNSYPDFRMVRDPVGFEVKGLAYPGREADYDANSQVPVGFHNGRTIFYVFGRYPSDPDGDSYPVLDLVVCHGALLNADTTYIHLNRSVRAFGSYGDLLPRDRKMYVAPTPFALLGGTTHHATLVLPADDVPGDGFVQVGQATRTEVERLMSGYTFDFDTNELVPMFKPNPNAGQDHHFKAWRVESDPTGDEVSLAGTADGDDELELPE